MPSPFGFSFVRPSGICIFFVEVMGRDASVVSSHEASINPVVRAIISSDIKVDATADTVKYNIKPHKFFLFNKETEQRVYFEVK